MDATERINYYKNELDILDKVEKICGLNWSQTYKKQQYTEKLQHYTEKAIRDEINREAEK